MISVQTNVTSLIAQENLRVDTNFQSRTIQRLTSGYRINSSGDDPAGLAVANGYRNSEAELTQGIQNANDGISTLQIIDGGENNIGQILDRLKTLATQSASDTFNGSRQVLNSEFQGLVSEINRQAQSIGLDQNGTFARNLSVYIGGGRAQGTTTAATNSSLQFDLSNATVDAKSLGLTGMQALGGTVGTTDIGNGSAKTSVSAILAQNTTPIADETDFYVSGPGFSGANKVKVAVNTSSVSDTNSLVTAINDAIANAGNNATQAASTFKAANVTASINTDSTGKQQLAFSSSTTAFQVEAGDSVANALLGNFANASTSAAAATMGSTYTGGATSAAATTLANPANISFQVQGAGLASPVTITLKSASTTVGAAVTDLESQVTANSTLAGAGITVTQASAQAPLVFHSARGEQLQVNVTGDTANALGMGSFVAGSNGAVDYTALNAAAFSTSQNYGSATLQFSINGQASSANAVTVDMTAGPNATAATVTSSDSTAGTVAINPNNNTLNLVVNGTAVSVALNTDAAATKNDIAAQIDSVTSAHGVTASVVGNAITLTDTTKGAGGTIQVLNGTANGILGLSAQLQRGASATAADVAGQINQAVANNTTLAAAGIQADGSSGSLVITSSNNTNFRLNAVGGTTAAATLTGATGSDTAATAAVKLGALASGGPFAIEANTNDQINLKIDGGATQTITLTAGATQSQASILQDINNVLGTSATASFSNNKLTIVSASTGTASSVQILAGSANSTVGLTTGLQTGAAATGAFQTLGQGTFSFGTNTTLKINVAGANGNADQSFTLTNGSVDSVVTQLSGLLGATASNSNGHLKITTTTGTAVTIVAGANDASGTLGLTTGVASDAVAAAGAYKTGGTAPSAAVTGANDILEVSVDGGGPQDITLTHGTFTASQIAGQINGQLVGGTASVVGGNLTITSNTLSSASSVTVGGGLDTGAGNLGFTNLGVAATNGVDAAAGTQTGSTYGAFTVNPVENDKLTIKVAGADGNANQTITFANTDTTVDLMVTKINATLIGAIASKDGSGHLKITTGTQNAGTGTAVTIVGGGVGDASGTVGLTTGVTNTNIAATGAYKVGGIAPGAAIDGTNDKLAITFASGGGEQDIVLTHGTFTNLQIAGQINQTLTGGTASVDGTGHLVITSTATGASSGVTVGGGADTAAANLGFVGTTEVQNGTDASAGTESGSAAGPFTVTNAASVNNTLTVAINGGSNQTITLTTGASQSAATIASQINAQLLGGTATVQNGSLVIASNATGTTNDSVKITAGGAGDASQLLKPGLVTNTASNGVNASSATEQGSAIAANVDILSANNDVLAVTIDAGSTQNITLAAGSQTAADLVANINNQLTGATAYIDQTTGKLAIASNSTGLTTPNASSVQVGGTAATALGFTSTTATGADAVAGYTVGGTNDTLTVQVDGGNAQAITLAHGVGLSAASVAGDIQTKLQALGGAFANVTAAADPTDHVIKISSGTTGASSSISVSVSTNDAAGTLGLAEGAVYHGTAQDVGYGTGGVSFTGNTATAPNEKLVSSGGATSTGALSFSALAYGSDSQAISVSATDSSGQLQSATITLNNDSTSRTGRSLDETVAAINTALQQTNIKTLQSVVAVKDDSTGSERINFISSLAAFQVSVGSTGSGTGIGSQGSTVKAAALAGGSSLDISSQQGGTQAIAALTTAVSALGAAQANVGKAQNTLNYAIGLAESQTANLSAAESRIRDADMASEAANLTKAQVLQQSAIAAMVQANSAPQAVLTLLRG
jgi:flagellin